MKKLFSLLAFLFLFSAAASAQTIINGNQVFVPGGGIGTQIPNEGVTGTTLHKLAKLTGSGTAIISGTTDTSGVEGVVGFGAGTVGNASVIKVGQTLCAFDGATVANHYVINSPTIPGDCSDGGAVLPLSQNLGRVLSTNASAGSYEILVSVGGGSSSTGGTPGGSNTQIQFNNGVGFGGASGITTPDGSALYIKGPDPYRDAAAYGVVNSILTNTATCVSGSPTVTLNAAGDWKNGQDISILGCGAPSTATVPDFTAFTISAISRVSNVVTATISNTATFGGTYVQLSGFTGGHTAFNGVFINPTVLNSTQIQWAQTAADDSSSGGTMTPGVALYEGTNPGATTYAYTVCAIGTGGGCSAKSQALTITNGPATLTELDDVWLYFSTWSATGLPTGVDFLCVYRNSSFIGRTYYPGYKDDGKIWARNPNCPATSPSTATPDTLTTTIQSGAGTTSLTLAANAGTSASGLEAFHDAAPAINRAVVDAKADFAAKFSQPNVILPFGEYMVSRLAIGGYRLDVTGSLLPTTHPIIVNAGGTFQGHGGQVSNRINYQSDDQANIGQLTPMDSFLLTAGGGGNSIRGAAIGGNSGHFIVIGASPTNAANGITIQNINCTGAGGGDCLFAEGNSIFVKVRDFNCQASTIAGFGDPTNRSCIYFTNTYTATGWVDWDIRNTVLFNGAFHMDSLAPSLGGPIAFSANTLDVIETEAMPAGGMFTIDAGCFQSPTLVQTATPLMVGNSYSNFKIADQAPFKGFLYFSRGGTIGCTRAKTIGARDPLVNVPFTDPFIGEDVPVGADDVQVSNVLIDSTSSNFNSDQNTGNGAIRLQPGRELFGQPMYLNFLNRFGTDFPSGAYLIPPPSVVLSDGGPGGSCGAGLTKYFALSLGDGAGGFTKTFETSTTTGAGGEIIQLLYGTSIGSGIVGAKYRIWVGSTSGGENQYYETTNPGVFNYGCGAPTGSGSPPTNSTAYFWKIPSQSGIVGSNPGWYGLASTDLFGFGKTNPAYTVDISGLVNSDKGIVLQETTAPSGISSADVFFGSSSAHWPKFIPNAGSTFYVTGTDGSGVSGHCAQFTDLHTIIDNGSACGSGGTGTVTTFSSGNLSPLFTTSVATPGTTPALSFTLSTAAAHTFYMNNTGSTATPGFQTAGEGDLPAATVFTDQNATFGAHTYDFSSATTLKAKVAAAYAPTVDGQFGVNSTTHLPVFGFNSASTITIPTTQATVSHQFFTSYTQTTGAFTLAQPTLADIAGGVSSAGAYDFSAATDFDLPVSAGCATTANGDICYDTTNKNWHVWDNGADKLAAVWNAAPTNGNCVKASVASSVVLLTDAACTGSTVQTNGVNLTTQSPVSFNDSTGASGIAWTNPSAGIVQASLANVAGGGNSTLQGTLSGFAQGDFLCGDGTPKIINCVSGVTPNAQTGTTYTVVGGDGGTSDRGKFLTFSNTSAVAVTLPQAGTTGFASNFFFTVRNINGGAVTITPTVSTVNGGASLVLFGGQQANIISDNTNYFATISGMPWQVGSAKATAQTSSISATTIFATGGNDALYRTSIDVDCTSTAAAETLAPAIKFTDTSGTVQTITGSNAVCTTLGSASISNQTISFQAKASTNIQYLVTASASTATWNVRVSVEQLSLN